MHKEVLHVLVLIVKCYYGDQTRRQEMGGICSLHESIFVFIFNPQFGVLGQSDPRQSLAAANCSFTQKPLPDICVTVSSMSFRTSSKWISRSLWTILNQACCKSKLYENTTVTSSYTYCILASCYIRFTLNICTFVHQCNTFTFYLILLVHMFRPHTAIFNCYSILSSIPSAEAP
jgi:hypothetical protein